MKYLWFPPVFGVWPVRPLSVQAGSHYYCCFEANKFIYTQRVAALRQQHHYILGGEFYFLTPAIPISADDFGAPPRKKTLEPLACLEPFLLLEPLVSLEPFMLES